MSVQVIHDVIDHHQTHQTDEHEFAKLCQHIRVIAVECPESVDEIFDNDTDDETNGVGYQQGNFFCFEQTGGNANVYPETHPAGDEEHGEKYQYIYQSAANIGESDGQDELISTA